MTVGERRGTDADAGAGHAVVGTDEPVAAIGVVMSDVVVSGMIYDGYGRETGGGLVLGGGVPARAFLRGYLGEVDAPGALAVSGLVDVRCHGESGTSFPDDVDPRSIRKAVGAHCASGTMALLASLVLTVDPLSAIRVLAPFYEPGELVGIYMEGSYVSPHKIDT